MGAARCSPGIHAAKAIDPRELVITIARLMGRVSDSSGDRDRNLRANCAMSKAARQRSMWRLRSQKRSRFNDLQTAWRSV